MKRLMIKIVNKLLQITIESMILPILYFNYQCDALKPDVER